MKSLWGGRFKKEMHSTLKCFSYSLYVDYQLLEAELKVNEAWVAMLARVGLLARPEAGRLARALKSVASQLLPKDPHERLPEKFLKAYEDIHTLILAQLERKVGALAKKLHTGRSRNDLVITSTRVYLMAKARGIESRLTAVQKSLVTLAKKAGDTVMAGLTHLRGAQPVLLAHHLLAYVEMLEEDRSRLADAFKRIDVLGLGSAALAGSGIPVDQRFLARKLGFSKVSANSLAAVSDRGVLTEFAGVLAILWMHLSRLAEDFILWNSEPFGYVELDDAFATGSSLMPQKKNPDLFELIRGRAAVIFGHLQTLLTVQKGLALAYNRDLQEDKPPLFDAVNKTELALEVLALALPSVAFKRDALEEALREEGLYATDLLDYLVKKGVAFSDAHRAVGRAVRASRESGKPLRGLSMKEWRGFSPHFADSVYDLFDAEISVRGKRTIGSTHPTMVKNQIKHWEKLLK